MDRTHNTQRKSRKANHEKSNEIQKRTKSLQDLVERYFSGKYKILETCLSVKALELIEGVTLPFCLILVVRPGSSKSTILYTIESLGNCYSTDAFTPKSFVSHMANVAEEDLSKIDLLPKIKGKTFITPELAPLFSAQDEKLLETIGILTKILDGKGFKSESGARGQRGYEGNYFFTWLGAIVEISSKVWNVIGFMGPKMYFLRLPEESISEQDQRNKILANMKDKSYEQKLGEVKKQAKLFWEIIQNHPSKKNGKIVWDEPEDDPKTKERIVILAQKLARLRAYLPTRDTANTSGSNYGYERPIFEDPERASFALYNLARGHAVICGRNFVIDEDLTVVIDVALSSAPRDRSELLKLLIENGGQLTTSQMVKHLHITNDTALKKMKQFELLELVERKTIPGNTKPEFGIRLKDCHWFLTEDFKSLCR